jgi:hypothetical protein
VTEHESLPQGVAGAAERPTILRRPCVAVGKGARHPSSDGRRQVDAPEAVIREIGLEPQVVVRGLASQVEKQARRVWKRARLLSRGHNA